MQSSSDPDQNTLTGSAAIDAEPHTVYAIVLHHILTVHAGARAAEMIAGTLYDALSDAGRRMLCVVTMANLERVVDEVRGAASRGHVDSLVVLRHLDDIIERDPPCGSMAILVRVAQAQDSASPIGLAKIAVASPETSAALGAVIAQMRGQAPQTWGN